MGSNCLFEMFRLEFVMMNSEKQIAQTVMDAQKMREESWNKITHKYDLEIEACLIAAGKENKLSPNLWMLLSLAMHWWNDIQSWAEDILAGKDIKTEP